MRKSSAKVVASFSLVFGSAKEKMGGVWGWQRETADRPGGFYVTAPWTVVLHFRTKCPALMCATTISASVLIRSKSANDRWHFCVI